MNNRTMWALRIATIVLFGWVVYWLHGRLVWPLYIACVSAYLLFISYRTGANIWLKRALGLTLTAGLVWLVNARFDWYLLLTCSCLFVLGVWHRVRQQEKERSRR